jgi:hypothetical protein
MSNTSTTLQSASDVSSVKNATMDSININSINASKSNKNDGSKSKPLPDFNTNFG